MTGHILADMIGSLAAPTFGIGELANAFGITTRTIRFYEARGLLAPRRIGKTRVYGERDRVRLQLILRGKRLGFSLAEIREWLDLYDLEDGRRRQYEVLLTESRRRIGDLERQLDDLTQTLGELKTIEAFALEQLADKPIGQDRKAATFGISNPSRDRLTAAAGKKGCV